MENSVLQHNKNSENLVEVVVVKVCSDELRCVEVRLGVASQSRMGRAGYGDLRCGTLCFGWLR